MIQTSFKAKYNIQTKMSQYRDKICSIIAKKTNLHPTICKDIEIGIFNWCIQYATTHEVVKSWKNNKFTKLYIEKSRSVINNLDVNSYIHNTNLITRMKEEEFLPHEVAFMKPENLYPDRWRNAVETLMKKYENAFKNKAQAMTNMFTECTFYELQTRAGDEASTIFVRCINCGNSWRQ